MLTTTLLIRLIKANQKAGKQVSIVDPEGVTAGGVVLEPNNIMHKMSCGPQRWYVADIVTLLNKQIISVQISG